MQLQASLRSIRLCRAGFQCVLICVRRTARKGSVTRNRPRFSSLSCGHSRSSNTGVTPRVFSSASVPPPGLRFSRTEYSQPQRCRGGPRQTAEEAQNKQVAKANSGPLGLLFASCVLCFGELLLHFEGGRVGVHFEDCGIAENLSKFCREAAPSIVLSTTKLPPAESNLV